MSTEITIAPLSSAEYSTVMTNLKVLRVLYGYKLTMLYSKGKLREADKLLHKLRVIFAMMDMLCNYAPESDINWITDDEATYFVDYLNQYFEECNIRNEQYVLPLLIENNVLTYDNGATTTHQNGDLVRYYKGS